MIYGNQNMPRYAAPVEHRCPSRSPTCAPAALCPGCYSHALLSRRGQADVLGQQWAERVGRRSEFHDRTAWPDDARALEMAGAKVVNLTPDPRLRVELAKACLAGAAAWWERRPARYRR